ncbi:MAG: hypothetical protein D8M52_05640 [Chlorobi bacterium]|nr:hypothetical protein [Chlorobiota bacterium]
MDIGIQPTAQSGIQVLMLFINHTHTKFLVECVIFYKIWQFQHMYTQILTLVKTACIQTNKKLMHRFIKYGLQMSYTILVKLTLILIILGVIHYII